ncbi:MAG: GDP-mannose 4,6-dehydratase [Candidatus Liptonbacteria bacterium]|nr:GDP-mannose 4,6-dehydratase [Candidatus Liptonbacteria bacterium]
MATKIKKTKNILVTGGAGFVGHHFVEHVLKNTDWNVRVLDSLNYAGNLNRIYEIKEFDPKRVVFVWHDLRAPIRGATKKLIGDIDYCVHFAGESHVDRSIEDSIPFVLTNVLGTANLLEYIKRNQPGCKTLIFSTDEVFGTAGNEVQYNEDSPFRPSNPYAASKAGGEMIAFSFAHTFKLPISIVRSMNIVGTRQHPEKFVPKTIRAIFKNEKVIIHGRNKNDLSLRHWIPAKNVAAGLMFLLDKAEPGQFYSISGEERSVLDVANILSEAIKKRPLKSGEIKFVEYETARPGHDKRYSLSGEKMARMGWEPPTNIDSYLREIATWTIKNPHWLQD